VVAIDSGQTAILRLSRLLLYIRLGATLAPSRIDLEEVDALDAKVQILPVDQLSPDEESSLQALRSAAYPPGTSAVWPGRDRELAGPAYRVLVWDSDGRLAAHAGLLLRNALANEQPVRVGGIGGVLTHPQLRRQGMAAAAMANAVEFFRHLGDVDFALLVCESHLLAYYTRLGWRQFGGRLIVRQWGESEEFTFNQVMTYPIRSSLPPEGVIDLLGPPW
jgi:aminoglycoside 2'-N-acetyltransferase I